MGGNQLGFTCGEVGTAVEDGSASKVSRSTKFETMDLQRKETE